MVCGCSVRVCVGAYVCVLFSCCVVLYGVRVLCAVCVCVRVLALCVLFVMCSMWLGWLRDCACVVCGYVWMCVNL